MKYIETYKIDIGKNFYNDIKVKQNDTARYIRFEIFQNSIPLVLTGKNVRIYGIKPDKKVLWNSCTIEDAQNGKVLVPITSQIVAVDGIVKAELTIIDGDNILSTFPFEIRVIPCIRNDEAVESTNEFKDVFSTKITTSTVVDGVLQLTKDKYQIAEVPSGTEIRMPEGVRADEYTSVNLVVSNSVNERFFIFQEDIKWAKKPNFIAGDYIINFSCINNKWYASYENYITYEKEYLIKDGDFNSGFTGGYDIINYNSSQTSEKINEYFAIKIYTDNLWATQSQTYYSYIVTKNEIDLSNYSKLILNFSVAGIYDWETGEKQRFKVTIGDTEIYSKSGFFSKDLIEIDISNINEKGKISFYAGVYATVNGAIYGSTQVNIYNAWLE